jgi:prostaglandin-H2 D-isomerase / glutathione transferase
LKVKAQMPFGALPVLYVDGVPLAQSIAINRYVGKLSDLYPSDPFQAALCDEAMSTAEEVNMHLGATMMLSDEEKKQKRLHLVSSVLPAFLTGLESKLKVAGGRFFSNGRLSVADLSVSELIRWLRSGVLDHLPADLVDTLAPELALHSERIKNEPKIMAYYKSRSTH